MAITIYLLQVFPFVLFSIFLYRFWLLRVLPTGKISVPNGPRSYPVLGCLISFSNNSYRLLDWYTELLAESPTQTISIRRLGATPTIVTANPDNVEYMLKTKFTNFPKGKPFTDILGDLLGNGIFNVDGELWRTQRKVASHEFSTKMLRELVFKCLENEAGERLLPLLDSAASSKTPLDMQDVLGRFTFDTICNISFGSDPGYLLPSMPVSSLAKAFDVAASISARRAAAPVFALWKAKRLLGVGSERQLKSAVELVRMSVMELIRGKKLSLVNGDGGGEDLLSRFVMGGYDEEVVRDMVISFMMAGKDTTSAALTWFFWLMSRHPEIQNEVVKEIKLEKQNKGLLGYDEFKEMKLLKACLCETMRLYPPVPWDSKHALEDDLLPDGTFVGKGHRVTYFPYGMGRMESIWGNDCLEFKPQRWLDLDKNSDSFSVYKFPVFQAGPRVCLGKEMAFIQMKYVAATVLSRFVLEPVSSDEPKYLPLLTAHMAGGLSMLVNERKP